MTNQKLLKIILFFTVLQIIGSIVLLVRIANLELEFINELLCLILLIAIIYYAVYLIILIRHIKRNISFWRIVFLSFFCFLPVILSGLLIIFVYFYTNKLYEN